MKQQSFSSPKWSSLLGAAAVGALGMYYSDPERGRRRRARAQDRLRHAQAQATHSMDVVARDFLNRMAGMQARASSLLRRGSQEAADDVVAARIRAKLGRVVSHPHAISAVVRNGNAELGGPILERERHPLLRMVRTVPGVKDIRDKLQAHKHAPSLPGLQGGSGRVEMRSGFMRENWAPALRATAVLGGGLLGAFGLARRNPAGTVLAVAGLGALLRGMTNQPVRRLTGIGAGHHAIELRKAIEIMAPPEAVFDAWATYDNFPLFMSHVLEVRDLGDLRSHWVVQGPMGARIEWNACLTECKRPFVIAWKTEPGSVVEHAGVVRFDPTESGTRATVRLSYNPPAGILGHGVAVLLGADPKRELDDDLLRMKSFIETGIMPHDAARHGELKPSGLG
ncbi:SRPBCC family protein [Noviherbaspirillum agri]